MRLKDPQQQCKISWNIPKTWYKIVGHYEDGLYESLRDEVVFPFCGHLWNNCPIQERKYSNDIMSNLNSKLINWQLKIISMRNELILYLMNFLNKLLTNLWMWLRKWNYCVYIILHVLELFLYSYASIFWINFNFHLILWHSNFYSFINLINEAENNFFFSLIEKLILYYYSIYFTTESLQVKRLTKW